jgi:hypothetical protein
VNFEVGDLARLKISKAAEGHYYKNGDIVRILQVWEETSGSTYRVDILGSNRVLHWLPKDNDLEEVHPLEQLADVAEDEDE